MNFALDGIRVLDLSRNIAGSYAGLLLAEQGADCVKIEPKPNGKQHRQVEFALFNRSKRSLVLNFNQQEGLDTLQRLVCHADVIVEDFSVPKKKELLLNYRALSKINPLLIYCSISQLGERGPLKTRPANEDVVKAFAGSMRSQGGLSGLPVFVFLPLASYSAAMLAAYGISLALYARQFTHRGQKVDTSLLAGAITMEAGAFIAAPGITPIATGENIQQGVLPGYRLYRCKDGKWVMLACGNFTFWNKFCMALDRLDLLTDPRFEGMPWALRDAGNRKLLTNILAELFNTQDSHYWLQLLEKNDVPCAIVNSREEFANDPQVLHNDMIVDLTDPYLGEMQQMGIPIALDKNPPRKISPAPRYGQHTAQILRESGFETREITGLKKKGII